MAGALPSEFGGVLAEVLAAEYPRLIYITAFTTKMEPDAPDGLLYRYFYYDALYKGMLPSCPERESRLAESDKQRAETEGDKSFEVQRGGRMDSVLYFQDLWTTCALKWFNTTWSPHFVERMTAPHLIYPDVGGPQEVIHRPDEHEEYGRGVFTLPN